MIVQHNDHLRQLTTLLAMDKITILQKTCQEMDTVNNIYQVKSTKLQLRFVNVIIVGENVIEEDVRCS